MKGRESVSNGYTQASRCAKWVGIGKIQAMETDLDSEAFASCCEPDMGIAIMRETVGAGIRWMMFQNALWVILQGGAGDPSVKV